MPDDTTPKADQFRYDLICEVYSNELRFGLSSTGFEKVGRTIVISSPIPPEMLDRGFTADINGLSLFFDFKGRKGGRLRFEATGQGAVRHLNKLAGGSVSATIYGHFDRTHTNPVPARARLFADIPVPAAKPTLVRGGFGFLQVCVPAGWSDAEVVDFTMREVPREEGFVWQIRRADDAAPNCCPERMPCARHPGFVHIILDA